MLPHEGYPGAVRRPGRITFLHIIAPGHVFLVGAGGAHGVDVLVALEGNLLPISREGRTAVEVPAVGESGLVISVGLHSVDLRVADVGARVNEDYLAVVSWECSLRWLGGCA